MLLSALLGPLPGCGDDSDPPAPPPELTLAVVPAQAWCCPGSSAPAPCPLVALELPDADEKGAATTRLVSSLEATMADQLTGLIVPFAPPGRCVNVSGACGHLAVSVTDGAGALLFDNGYVQRFGAGEFEFLVGGSETGTRRVRVEARDDADQPLLDPSGAPLAVELSLEVRVVHQAQAGAPAPTADEACAPPSGLGCRAKKARAGAGRARGTLAGAGAAEKNREVKPLLRWRQSVPLGKLLHMGSRREKRPTGVRVASPKVPAPAFAHASEGAGPPPRS